MTDSNKKSFTKPNNDFVTNESLQVPFNDEPKHVTNSKAESPPNIKFDNRKWLTTKGAAEYLGTTTGNIRNLVWKGKLPAHKPFGKLLFEKAHLDRLVIQARIWQ